MHVGMTHPHAVLFLGQPFLCFKILFRSFFFPTYCPPPIVYHYQFPTIYSNYPNFEVAFLTSVSILALVLNTPTCMKSNNFINSDHKLNRPNAGPGHVTHWK